MKIKISPKRHGKLGYTLVEMLFAVSITSIMFFAGLSAITFSKIQLMKDKERAIISDFSVHYLETLRALSFDNLTPGMPINPLYDGTLRNELGNTVTLLIPNNNSWVNITTSDYNAFGWDLPYMSRRNPQMRVTIDNTVVGTTVRSKHVQLDVSWDSPLGYGARNTMRLDMVRLRDIETMQ